MSANPHQRKSISLNELFELRSKLREAFSISKKGEELLTPKNKNSPYYTSLKEDIFDKTQETISEGTLLKFFHDDQNRAYQLIKLEIINKYISNCFPATEKGIITHSGWNTSTNVSTPQWADYLKIPITGGLIKRIRCKVVTSSPYYRFGFKLLRKNGKLFGDGSIQSQDNNFVIHVGKNFLSDELFITSYHNGIRQRPDKYTGITPLHNRYEVELFIDPENFIHLLINGNGVFKIIVNKEIREQAYMLTWGDGNEYQLLIENIEFEFSDK